MGIMKTSKAPICFIILLFVLSALSMQPALAQQTNEDVTVLRYPNTAAKDMDADMPWRVEDENTEIPVIWIIKDSDQFLAEVDEMKYVVLYDVSDGYIPPSNWDKPLTDHVVYYHDFNDMEISQDYWYWLTTTFEKDGSYNGSQPDGTAFTPAKLGYQKGDTISFTLRLYGKDGIWPFYTDVTLDKDMKVHVGEEKLPTVKDWYWGDVHNHGWATDNLYEYADPIIAKALAASSMGLSFVTITDHASDLSTSKWNSLGNECAQYSTSTLRLIRGEEMHANQGGLLEVRHMLGYGLTTYVEGAENGTYKIKELLGGPVPANHLTAQGAFAYASHPTDPSLGWKYSEVEEALGFAPFVGLQFFNERNGYFSETNWSDDDDEYHPWGGDESIAPHNRDFTVDNSSWDSDLNQGLLMWDNLMSDRLDPVRKIFMSGGSDAHGDWNYRVYRTTSLDITATSSAMGKARTGVYLPNGLTDQGILDCLRDGRTIISDGPAMVFGIDSDNDGDIDDETDSIIGDGPVHRFPSDPDGAFRFFWNSSAELGDVDCIRLLKGDATTGQDPVVVWEYFPHSYNGNFAGPAVSAQIPPLGETAYFRAEAYAFDPNGPVPLAGDVSNYSYNAVTNDYNYRCFTNPIWVTTVGLGADVSQISASSGGSVNFTLYASPENSGRSYILLGTVSGVSPGIVLPGGLSTLPLNFDIFTMLIAANLNSPMFHDFMGVLDAKGGAAATLNTFGPLPSGMVGVTLSFAYALNKPWDFASNPVEILVTP